MKNPDLVRLNFVELINYGGQPEVRSKYAPPLSCSGYCTDCEKAGLTGTDLHLDQMSHGADTSDYEQILGPLPGNEKSFDMPVLFLLENPGGDYGNGAEFHYEGIVKRPPVNHYYWTPSDESTWPKSTDELSNYYGPYFAYIMYGFGLHSVYITNIFKCNLRNKKNKNHPELSNIVKKCIDKFLVEELRFFLPKIVFCFGRRTESLLKRHLRQEDITFEVVYLYHPAAIASARRYRSTPQKMFRENDDRILAAIKKVCERV